MKLETHYLQHLKLGYDRNAILEDLMKDYGNDIWNFAYYLTKHPQAADDIAQEVFLAVYERMYSFRGECAIKSWLLAITRNKSLSYMKTSFIRNITLMDKVPSRDVSPSAEAVILNQLATREIWQAVLALPRKFREVIVLDYHYQLPIREIAELMQVSEGTVKSRSHRARRKLAAILGDMEGTDK